MWLISFWMSFPEEFVLFISYIYSNRCRDVRLANCGLWSFNQTQGRWLETHLAETCGGAGYFILSCYFVVMNIQIMSTSF